MVSQQTSVIFSSTALSLEVWHVCTCARLSTESLSGVIWDDHCKRKRLLMLITKTFGGKPVPVP